MSANRAKNRDRFPGINVLYFTKISTYIPFSLFLLYLYFFYCFNILLSRFSFALPVIHHVSLFSLFEIRI